MYLDAINQRRVMQVATQRNDQPWICTVYFVLSAGNFYWLSLPQRRHSQDLENNQKAAIAIAIREEKPVVGLQAEGDVHVVQDIDEINRVLKIYVAKYGQGEQFVGRFKTGNNQHELYRFTPSLMMVFDELTSSKTPYRSIEFHELSNSVQRDVTGQIGG